MIFRDKLEQLIAQIPLTDSEKDNFVGHISNDFLARRGFLCYNENDFVNAFNKISRSGNLLGLLVEMENGKRNGFSTDPCLDPDETPAG